MSAYTNPPGLSHEDRHDLDTALDLLDRALSCDWSHKVDEDFAGRWLDEAKEKLKARQAVRYALRHKGAGSEYVSKLPHEFMDENYVQGNDNPDMLTWGSEEDAKWARYSDPDGDSLTVEEVNL